MSFIIELTGRRYGCMSLSSVAYVMMEYWGKGSMNFLNAEFSKDELDKRFSIMFPIKQKITYYTSSPKAGFSRLDFKNILHQSINKSNRHNTGVYRKLLKIINIIEL